MPEFKKGERVYTIKAGDSLSKIARDVLGNIGYWRTLALINNIKSPYTIYPGQQIKLPGIVVPPAPKYEPVTIDEKTGDVVPPRKDFDFMQKLGPILKNPFFMAAIGIGLIAILLTKKRG